MMVLAEAVHWNEYDVLSWRQMTEARFDLVIPARRSLFDIGNLLNLTISHEETYSSRY